MNAAEIDHAIKTGKPVILNSQTDGMIFCALLGRTVQHVRLLTLGQVRSVSQRLLRIADVYKMRPEAVVGSISPPGRLLKAHMYSVTPSGNDTGRNAVQALQDLRAAYAGINGHIYQQAALCYAAAADLLKSKGATATGVLMWLPKHMAGDGVRIFGSLPETWLKRYGCRQPPRMSLYSVPVTYMLSMLGNEDYLSLFRRLHPAGK